MTLHDLFQTQYIGDRDTDTHRVGGSCGELKPVEAFYKDGKNRDGTIRYRRDCRDCYKKTRISDAKRRNK